MTQGLGFDPLKVLLGKLTHSGLPQYGINYDPARDYDTGAVYKML
jgi:hypothetical protein